MDELIQELKRIRNVGYAFDQEERFIGMRCIGAPVFNSNNQVVAGISISGPVARMSDDLIVQLGQETARHGEEISKQLGAGADL